MRGTVATTSVKFQLSLAKVVTSVVHMNTVSYVCHVSPTHTHSTTHTYTYLRDFHTKITDAWPPGSSLPDYRILYRIDRNKLQVACVAQCAARRRGQKTSHARTEREFCMPRLSHHFRKQVRAIRAPNEGTQDFGHTRASITLSS